jgi:hypothetical protein
VLAIFAPDSTTFGNTSVNDLIFSTNEKIVSRKDNTALSSCCREHLNVSEADVRRHISFAASWARPPLKQYVISAIIFAHTPCISIIGTALGIDEDGVDGAEESCALALLPAASLACWGSGMRENIITSLLYYVLYNIDLYRLLIIIRFR